ncbi:hypothetical protein AGMMS49965_21080 [Bacteroidia bacterium]|nr:hypothetical protein AGMMS49965_21080 [Bacteroidia bacterium]
MEVKAYVTSSNNEPLDEDKEFPAPVEIRFEAISTLTEALYIWKIFQIDPDTNDTTTVMRYADQSVTYTFKESGLFQAQLEVVPKETSDFTSCDLDFSIRIGEADLKLPNAFSPNGNNKYRVRYKSIVRFKASIYNRSGKLLYSWRDPAEGWDGRVGGQIVPTGVYFIIVDAQGADGKVYKLSKDINVLR